METTTTLPMLSISISISMSIFFLLFTCTTIASPVVFCPPSSCDETGPVIQFPFRIKGFQPDRCGYPGYDITCNNISQTILTLPNSGDFVVHEIDYFNQWIYINDPNSCLPNRILHFNLTGSKFKPSYSKNYTLFNCSTSNWSDYIVPGSAPLFCLGSANFTVMALDSGGDSRNASGLLSSSVCREFARVESPVELTAVNPIPDIRLAWRMPICMICQAAGGACGYVEETGNEVGCLNFDGGSGDGSRGLPRSAKYGLIIGVGIPGLVCLMALVCYCCGRVKMHSQRRRLDAQLSNLTSNPQPMVIITGLDGPTIESYPKTVLGESRRLPRPNDGTCPICLGEYQPKETLRTIPECNHYFHAKCVDEWLRMNATCPLCRHTPAESSVVTPSSSVSSSSSLSTS